MKTTMRWAAVAGSAMLAGALLTACESDTTTPDAGTTPDSGTTTNPDSGTTPDTGTTTGFQQPANTVPINFIIDDSANKSYGANELKWKGSWQYNETTRKITRDTSWAGGDSTKYPFLYDDGAWNMGGHEPAGAVAGDNKWGITTFIDKSDMAIALEYGAEAVAAPTDTAGGWIWRGANGMIMIPANSTEAVNAQGLTIPAWGTTDFRLTINTSTLAGGFTYTAGQPLKVKGSAWGWSEIDLTAVTGEAGVYEFILGPNVGAGTPRKHSGKLNAGDKPEFVFTINNIEYKVGGEASAFSVKAYVKAAGATTWTEVQIMKYTGMGANGNTYITTPAAGAGFQQPADTVALNFIIDDSANKSYGPSELKWKGSWQYNETTRKITRDTSWAGGDSTKYPFLYDDGAWNVGGHEPAGAVAGDNKWGVTTFIDKSAMETTLEYGAEAVASPTDTAGGWIWRGANGTIAIPANSTDPVNAQGLTIAAWGTTDFRLTIDTGMLAGGFMHTAGQPLKVKGSAWGWSEIDLAAVTGQAGVYEFVLGPNVGPGTPRKHSGKLGSGDRPEFVFTINNIEYKVGGEASAGGVKAYVKAAGAADWTEVQIMTFTGMGANGNTYITTP